MRQSRESLALDRIHRLIAKASKLRTRRTFSKAFKVEAIKLVTDRGLSPSEAARCSGVDTDRILGWMKVLEANQGK